MRRDARHLDLGVSGPRSELPNDEPVDEPFVARRFLEAASLLPPARGSGLTLSVNSTSGIHRWGVVELSRFGLKAAVGWAVPSSPPGVGRAAVWQPLLDAIADRGHAVLRMSSHSTVRLTPADVETLQDAALARGWGFRSSRFGTFVIDLCGPEEKRLQLMDRNHRQVVRRTGKADLALARIDEAGFEEFLRIMDETYTRQGLQPYPRAYFAHLFEDPAAFRFYAAVDPVGRHHATAIVAVRNQTGIYLHGGSGHRDLPGAGVWLHWMISNDLASSGFLKYDLGGVALDDDGPKATGIRNFKARFGGEFEEYVGVHVVFRPWLDATLQKTLTLARKLKLV